MRYSNNPEVIATIDMIDVDGNDSSYGDKIVGIQVRQSPEDRDGTVDLDIRSLDKKHNNLVIRISLPDLMAALSLATLNSDRDL